MKNWQAQTPKIEGYIWGAISPKFSAYIETIYVNKRL
jgi:hypothetical protein